MLDAIRNTQHVLLLLLFAFAFAGCSPQRPPANLVIVNGAEPGSLDPATSTGLEELRVTMALFEGLMRVDPVTAQPIPGLAERYEISPDRKTYTFHLRTNAVWSTGEPITARDFVYSWFRVLNPATASEYVGQLFYIKNAERWVNKQLTNRTEVGIHSPDDFTLQVELENPTPFFLDLCAFQTLSIVPWHLIERYGDHWMRVRPLSVSGAYQLESWRLNDRIRLRKNPRYWDASNTGCEVIDLLPIRSASTSLNLYERKEVDIIWDKEMIPSELYQTLRERSDFHSFNYLGTYFLRFNTTRKPLDDSRVRRALALTIDKQRLMDKIIKTGEPIAHQLVPPYTTNSLLIDAPRYDLETARRLLKDAGFEMGKGFPPIEYLFESVAGGASVHSKVGVELQQMWQEALGIRVELRQMEKRVYLKAQRSMEYDVTRSTWIGDYNDPVTFLDLFRSNNGNNRTGWKNAQYDELMDRAAREPDLKRRSQILRDAETLLVRDEAPIAPVYFFAGFNYYDPQRVSGITGNILDSHPLNAIRKLAKE